MRTVWVIKIVSYGHMAQWIEHLPSKQIIVCSNHTMASWDKKGIVSLCGDVTIQGYPGNRAMAGSPSGGADGWLDRIKSLLSVRLKSSTINHPRGVQFSHPPSYGASSSKPKSSTRERLRVGHMRLLRRMCSNPSCSTTHWATSQPSTYRPNPQIVRQVSSVLVKNGLHMAG